MNLSSQISEKYKEITNDYNLPIRFVEEYFLQSISHPFLTGIMIYRLLIPDLQLSKTLSRKNFTDCSVSGAPKNVAEKVAIPLQQFPSDARDTYR